MEDDITKDAYYSRISRPRHDTDIFVQFEVGQDIVNLIKARAGEQGVQKAYKMIGVKDSLLAQYGLMIPADVVNRLRMAAARIIFPGFSLEKGLEKVGEAYVEGILNTSYARVILRKYVFPIAGLIYGKNMIAQNYLKRVVRRANELIMGKKEHHKLILIDDRHAKVVIQGISPEPEFFVGTYRRGLELMGYWTRVSYDKEKRKEFYIELDIEWRKKVPAGR